MKVNTYDIINAGPKNRFMCNGKIVSNSGRLFQPQNLPRPKKPFKDAREVEIAIQAFKDGGIELLYNSPSEAASSCIRGALIADDGKKLAVSDLSSIEGRVAAWLAGERWKIKAYIDVDNGIGHDMYVLTYAHTFNVDPAKVGSEERPLGKVLELALGYGGGVGAFIAFSAVYGVDLDNMAAKALPVMPSDVKSDAAAYYVVCESNGRTYGLEKDTFIACDGVKRMWRAANPKIVQMWYDMESAMRSVIMRGGSVKVGACTFDKKGSWVRVRLPSGRYVCYPSAGIIDGKLRYFGVDQYKKKWTSISTYSGKIFENMVQAIARDILMDGIVEAEKRGYDVVLSVHDELVTEVPDTNEYSHEELSEIMTKGNTWSTGLPLNAEGYEAYRYRKE